MNSPHRPPPHGSYDFDEIFGGRGFGLDFGFAEDGGLFERFFGRRGGPAGGEDIEVVLTLPLEKVARGGEAVARAPRSEKCPDCEGTGCRAGTKPRECEACKGSGCQTSSSRKGGVCFQQVTTCPACDGKGRFIDKPCPKCDGRGEVARDDKITVKVPSGVEEGMTLRVPGHGKPSPQKGAAPGDLLVAIRSEPDARFERHGADLWRSETIDVADAALYTRLKVPTLDGEARLTVPAGTQPDTVLPLAGKGLPNFQARGHASLYVRISLVRAGQAVRRGTQAVGAIAGAAAKSGLAAPFGAAAPPLPQAEAAICQNPRGARPHCAAG